MQIFNIFKFNNAYCATAKAEILSCNMQDPESLTSNNANDANSNDTRKVLTKHDLFSSAKAEQVTDNNLEDIETGLITTQQTTFCFTIKTARAIFLPLTQYFSHNAV